MGSFIKSFSLSTLFILASCSQEKTQSTHATEQNIKTTQKESASTLVESNISNSTNSTRPPRPKKTTTATNTGSVSFPGSVSNSGSVSSLATITSSGNISTSPTSNTTTSTSSSNNVQTSSTSSNSVSCRAPRKYIFTLANYFPLGCNSTNNPFNVNIPDKGRALAIVTGLVFNYQASGNNYAIHSWSGSVDVGSTSFSKKMNFGSGEAVCGQQYGYLKMMGYGELSSGSQNVKINMSQYVSSGCTTAISVMPGALLTVWVEDDRAECAEKSIVAKSYFRSVWESQGSGTQKITYPTTSLTTVMTNQMNVSSGHYVNVYSQVETSIDSTQNVCGGQYETAGAYLESSGVYQGTNDHKAVIPVSAGITHGLYFPSLRFQAASSGMLYTTLSAYVDQTANAGGRAKIGETYSGDSMIAIVQE